MGFYLKSFSWSELKTIDPQLKHKALKGLLRLHQDYGIDIPRDRIIWHFSKYALERRTVQVFLDVCCFARAEIPRLLLKFIVSNVYDKMSPNKHFSLTKVWAKEDGDMAVDDLIAFNMPRIDAEERKK